VERQDALGHAATLPAARGALRDGNDDGAHAPLAPVCGDGQGGRARAHVTLPAGTRISTLDMPEIEATLRDCETLGLRAVAMLLRGRHGPDHDGVARRLANEHSCALSSDQRYEGKVRR
jgi:hypothetical protein